MSWFSDAADWASGLFNGTGDAPPVPSQSSIVQNASPMVTGQSPAGIQNDSPQPTSSGVPWYSSIGQFLQNNANWILPSVGMGITALKGTGSPPYSSVLKANAASLTDQGQQLVKAATTGRLPYGQENILNQELQQRIAQIRAKYAEMGLSGSTMEQQDIASAQSAAVSQRASLAGQATDTGMKMLGYSNDVYSNLARDQMAKDQALTSQIAALMKAFGQTMGSQSDEPSQS